MQEPNMPQPKIQKMSPPSNQPQKTFQQKPAETKGSNKLVTILLWILTALLFSALGAGAYWFLTKDQQRNCPEPQSCTYAGATYNDGDTFAATDGCNTCTCYNGQVACTLMACEETEQGESPTEEFGYIQEAYQEEGENFLKFSTAEFIDSSKVEKYEEFCGDEPEINCPNDYYIDESNSQTLNLKVTEDSIIKVILKYDGDCTLTSDPEDGFEIYSISYSDLINSTCDFIGDNSVPFEVSFTDSTIVELTEYYVP